MITYEKTKNTIIKLLETKTRVLVNVPVATRKSSLISTLINNWTQTENKKVLVIVPYKFIIKQNLQNLFDYPNVKIIDIHELLFKEKGLDDFIPDVILFDEMARSFDLVEIKVLREEEMNFSLFLNQLIPDSTTDIVGLVTSSIKKSSELLNIFEIQIDSEIATQISSNINIVMDQP